MPDDFHILPPDFQWPEAVEDARDIFEGGEMETSRDEGWSAAGVYPETFPRSRASRFSPGIDLEIPTMESPDSDRKQFSMQNPKESGGTWTVEVFPGWIYSIEAKLAHTGGEPLTKTMPEISGQPINQKSGAPAVYPRLTVAIGDTVTLRIERDKKGVIVPPVEVMIKPPGALSDHYDPDVISNDTGGDEQYIYWDVFDVVDDGNGNIEADPKWQDDVLLIPHLWTAEHVGTGREILKEFAQDEDVYKFRTLVEKWGIDMASANADQEIEIELDAINYGDDGAGGVDPGTEGEPILLSQAESIAAGDPDTAVLRRIAQGDTAARKQIEIAKEAGVIRVMGNAKNGSLTWNDCATPSPTSTVLLEWEDGLITTATDQAFTAGCPDGLPTGTLGDILYHDGTEWVILAPPVGPTAVSGAEWILASGGNAPYWVDSSTVVAKP